MNVWINTFFIENFKLLKKYIIPFKKKSKVNFHTIFTISIHERTNITSKYT